MDNSHILPINFQNTAQIPNPTPPPPVSPELEKWLKSRSEALRVKAALRAEGGHAMIKNTVVDPETLPEPLRTEAREYGRLMKLRDAK